MKQFSLLAIVVIFLISCNKDSEITPETQESKKEQESIDISGKWVVVDESIFDTLTFYGGNQYVVQHSNNKSGNNFYYGMYTKVKDNTFNLENLGSLTINKNSNGYDFIYITDTSNYNFSVKKSSDLNTLDEKTVKLCKVWKEVKGYTKVLFLPNNTYFGSTMPSYLMSWGWSSYKQDSLCTRYGLGSACEPSPNTYKRYSITFIKDTLNINYNSSIIKKLIPTTTFP